MSAVLMKPTRYAHSEGHVDLTFDDSGRYLLTCGSDGDVRLYKGFDDDDPVSYRVGDVIYSVAYSASRFYVSSDDNSVKVYTFPNGEADGIITRFMAPATHIVLNQSGSKLLAGSCDFTLKLVDVETSSQVMFQGHEAPVLSVAIHPDESLVASSSCDGTVKIWNIKDQKCCKTIPGLPKCNDFAASQTLSRLTWNKEGNYLIIPFAREVRVYETSGWQVSLVLTDDSIKENISITRFSPCWRYLVGACVDGLFIIWDFSERHVVQRLRHPQKQTVTALCWNPKQANQLAYCDSNGGLGFIEKVVPDEEINKKSIKGSKPSHADLVSDLFDDAEDDVLVDATNPVVGGPSDVGGPCSDEDSQDMVDIGRLKKEILGEFLDDENSKDTDADSLSGQKETESSTVNNGSIKTKPVYVQGFEPTPLQPPFQPSSSPVHFTHRFMVWNSVGIIVQYNTDEENSINVEFHDTAVHHSIHITNTLNHTMATLSDEAVLLACETDEETPSKLVCMHFASWDSNKEWTVDMPSGENIKTICLGEGWAAVGTDRRIIRLFTIGGVQLQILSIAGPVVTLAGHSNQMLIIYHAGMGVPGDQCLGVRLQTVTGPKYYCKLKGECLPLTPKSTLVWAGFSAEGTPFILDSHGIVRMFNRSFAESWIQVANLKNLCKGKSDNYWLCSLHENPQQIRAILCKGSRYPPTLPRPTVQILSYQLPLCDMMTDKGVLEETFCRSKLMSEHLHWWQSEGFEVDEAVKAQALMPQQESLMKLFALACKTGREYRAVELCELMPNHKTIQLAIKYASRLRMMQLAERLTQVIREKAENEMAQRALQMAGVDDEEDVDNDDNLNIRHQMNKVRVLPKQHNAANQPQHEEEMMEDKEEDVNDEPDVDDDDDDDDDQDQEQEQESKHKITMLKFGASKSREATPKSLSHSQGVAKNPFRVGSQQQTPAVLKGTRVFDSLDKTKVVTSKTPNELKNKAHGKQKKTVIKNKMLGQQKLAVLGTKRPNEISSTQERKERNTKAGFLLWLDSKEESLRKTNPDVEDITALAEKEFNNLSSDEQEEWNKKAEDASAEAEPRKRKRDIADEEDVENRESGEAVVNKMKIAKKAETQNTLQSGKSKLKNFVFEK